MAEISTKILREWWRNEVIASGRHVRTGKNYLGAIAAVMAFAEEELSDTPHEFESPVPRFRRWVSSQLRTKKGRAAEDPDKDKHPIETTEEIARLLESARREGVEEYACVVTLLDTGMRVGEVQALTWGQVRFGATKADTRQVIVLKNRPRGMVEPQPPKSGRSRVVDLSWRCREALRALYEARFKPGPSTAVFPDLDQSNFRERTFRRIKERAELGHVRPKDLRDTFASHLLSHGIQVGYIARQLGHAGTAITEKHYARWLPKADGRYRAPTPLAPDEVPADLLAREEITAEVISLAERR